MSARHIIANPHHASAQERYDRLRKFLSEVLPPELFAWAENEARELRKRASCGSGDPYFGLAIALAHFELEARAERNHAWQESTLATLGFT
jgi:hypothetical protein